MSLPSQFLAHEDAAAAFGARLAPLLRPCDIICLEGPLGAGKTTLARGLIKAYCGAREVPSPTFTLVETYQGREAALWHFDLYRLEQPNDVWELGLEDALDDGVCLIEWPDRIARLLPENVLRLNFHIPKDGGRMLHIEAGEDWRKRLQAAGII